MLTEQTIKELVSIQALIKKRIEEIEKQAKKEDETVRILLLSFSIRELNHVLYLFDKVLGIKP